MHTHAVFVYGTLLLPALQRRVTGREFALTPAIVHGYARRKVRGEAYPSLVPSTDECVLGALLADVDDASLARLDAYEGAPYERVRARVEPNDAGGEHREAWLWLLRAAERHRVTDEPWDLAAFVARDLARFEAEYEGLAER